MMNHTGHNLLGDLVYYKNLRMCLETSSITFHQGLLTCFLIPAGSLKNLWYIIHFAPTKLDLFTSVKTNVSKVWIFHPI